MTFREYNVVKPYLMKVKRHDDAILMMTSPDGINGSLLYSASADEKLRVWDMSETTVSKAMPFMRPEDGAIMGFSCLGEEAKPKLVLPVMSDAEVTPQDGAKGLFPSALMANEAT